LKNKTIQEEPEWLEHDGKRIYEAVIWDSFAYPL
jgi:hypothetical protein